MQKKQKLAEYTGTLPGRNFTSPTEIHTNRMSYADEAQEEPLNLVIRPQEEPLNLSTKCSAGSQITGKLEPLSSDRNENKVMKKVFSRITSKSGHSLWRLKKSKRKQQMGSLSKGDFRKKCQRKLNKENNINHPNTHSYQNSRIQTAETSASPDSSTNTTHTQGTKIKLIKVGDSYKIASNQNARLGSKGACVIDNKETEVTQHRTGLHRKCEDEKSSVMQEITNECEKPEKLPKSLGASGNPFGKPSFIQKIQVITLTKANAQDGTTVERKPVVLQIPTTSGGSRMVLVPQNQPRQPVVNTTLTQKLPSNQIKCHTGIVNNCSSKSGFPQVNESNRKRKVFKIGEDGTISCLGTLEEVQKSGLFVHKQEESNKQVKAKTILTPQPQKTTGNVTESNTENQPNYQEAVSKQKGIRRGSYSALDLSNRVKLLPFRSLTIGNPFMSQNNSQSSISVSQIKNLTPPTTVKEKSTSILQEKPTSELNINAQKASKKEDVSGLKNNSSKKSVELPHQENKALVNGNNKRAINTGSTNNSEKSEYLKNEISKKCEVEKVNKHEQKKKIRSKLRNKIKESYYSTKTKASKGYKRDENSNFKGKRSFRPPFYPVYGMRTEEIPQEKFLNRPGPAYYYPWYTGHQYPGKDLHLGAFPYMISFFF